MELSINDAAELLKVTRMAIYAAIQKGRIKTCLDGNGHMKIAYKDLETYEVSKYKRSESKFNGAKIFDKEKGLFSVKECANALGIKMQAVYFLLRVGKLKAEKKGAQLVISVETIRAYKEEYRSNYKIEEQVG